MGDDLVFGGMILVLLAGFLPIGIYHRIRAGTGERLSRREEGWLVLLGLRPLALLAGLGLMAFLIDPGWMRWSAVDLPAWMRGAGFPLGLAAAAWVSWMFRTLGANLTDTVAVREKAYLVTHGPYRWVRHPMYVGAAALSVSLGLLTANLFLFLTTATVVLLLALRTRTEEAKLIERFGRSYVTYARRTGRFFPRLRSITPST